MAAADTTGQPEKPYRSPFDRELTQAPVPVPADRQWPRSWQSPFLRSLSLIPDVSSACRLARIARQTAYDARNSQPDFAAAWEEALAMSFDYIDRHMHTWITTGVPIRTARTVTKRKVDRDGKLIETTSETVETESAERSATLMIFWAKAWNPDRYRWSERAEVTGADGGPLRIESVEEIDRKIAALVAEMEASGDPVPDE